MGYQLDVVSASVAEAVRYAGGLMFDRSAAGWRVRVVTDDAAHRRALTILGTHTQSPEQRDDALHNPNRVVRSLVLPVAQLTVDPRTPAVQDAEIESPAELLGWGQHVNSESTGLLHPVRHELSAAARTFKAEALRCAGLDPRVDACEEFWAAKTLNPAPYGHLRPNPHRSHDIGAPETTVDDRARSQLLVGGFPRG